MTDYQAFLIKLHQNLSLLRERESKYDANASVELLNQITDHQEAITLTCSVSSTDCRKVQWRDALEPLFIAICNFCRTIFLPSPRRPGQRWLR